jgi:hypothetical protein
MNTSMMKEANIVCLRLSFSKRLNKAACRIIISKIAQAMLEYLFSFTVLKIKAN